MVRVSIFFAVFLLSAYAYSDEIIGCDQETYKILSMRFPEWQVIDMCRQPIKQESKDQQISTKCVSRISSCEMPYPAPYGTPCYCNTELGVSPGEISR